MRSSYEYMNYLQVVQYFRRTPIGELGHPVDGQEHVTLAFTQSQLGTVNVNVANLHRSKLSPAAGFNFTGGKTRNTVLLQAAMQTRAGQHLECARAGNPSDHQEATSFVA